MQTLQEKINKEPVAQELLHHKLIIVGGFILGFFIINAGAMLAFTSYRNSHMTQGGASLSSDAVNTLHGHIVSLDAGDQMITVRDRETGETSRIKVADRSTLDSFTAGDSVRVTFPSTDRTTATSVVPEDNP